MDVSKRSGCCYLVISVLYFSDSRIKWTIKSDYRIMSIETMRKIQGFIQLIQIALVISGIDIIRFVTEIYLNQISTWSNVSQCRPVQLSRHEQLSFFSNSEFAFHPRWKWYLILLFGAISNSIRLICWRSCPLSELKSAILVEMSDWILTTGFSQATFQDSRRILRNPMELRFSSRFI